MIIKDVAIAFKYAKAFLNVFIEKISLADYKNIVILEQFLKSRRAALAFLILPHIEYKAKERALSSVIEKFSLPDCFNNLIRVLVKGRRAFLFPIILNTIALVYRKRKNIEDFVIQSSNQLDESALKEIEIFLSQKTGAKILSKHKIDNELIAGIRLMSDRYLWEYSIAKKLRTLMSCSSQAGVE